MSAWTNEDLVAWCEGECEGINGSMTHTGSPPKWEIGDLIEITGNFHDGSSNFWIANDRPPVGTKMIALSYPPGIGRAIVKVLYKDQIRYANSNLVKKAENPDG